jgi:precorrin-6B methylase 1
MKKRTTEEVSKLCEKVDALVKGGSSVTAAVKQLGVPLRDAAYYSWRRRNKKTARKKYARKEPVHHVIPLRPEPDEGVVMVKGTPGAVARLMLELGQGGGAEPWVADACCT